MSQQPNPLAGWSPPTIFTASGTSSLGGTWTTVSTTDTTPLCIHKDCIHCKITKLEKDIPDVFNESKPLRDAIYALDLRLQKLEKPKKRSKKK